MADKGGCSVQLIEEAAGSLAARQMIGRETAPSIRWIVGNALPECAQLLDPCSRSIAGDDGGIDGADGNAGDPIGVQIGLGQRLIDAGLIGAEGAAAL